MSGSGTRSTATHSDFGTRIPFAILDRADVLVGKGEVDVVDNIFGDGDLSRSTVFDEALVHGGRSTGTEEDRKAFRFPPLGVGSKAGGEKTTDNFLANDLGGGYNI